MKSWRFLIASALCFTVLGILSYLVEPASATTSPAPQTQVMATVHQFFDGINKNDMKLTIQTCASPASVIDDFPPHSWQGPAACADWASGFSADVKTNHITDNNVSLGKPWQLEITGDRAYVVVPATYAYKQNGKPALETGSIFTAALRKFAAGWRITGWAWSEH